MKTKYFYLIAALLSSQILTAQSLPSVKGKVTDDKNEVLPYADIRAHSLPDSAFITGGMTDEEGIFNFELKDGKYFLTVEFFEFKTDTLVVEINQKNKDLGIISLKIDQVSLGNVDVVAQRPVLEMKLDKRVYNVASDLSNQGTNASEMLENIPSVTVDAEGNVSLRGNQSVRILIDGKYSGFASTADALKQLQTDRVERVEIITNASARYDAEGDAGIINIILKKNQKDGFNGSVDLRAGYFPELGGGVNLNYRKGKLNYYGAFNINKNSNPGNSTTYQRLLGPDTTFAYRQTYEHNRNKFRHDATFGVDYDINDHNTIGAAINYRSGIGKNEMERYYDNLDISDNVVSRDTRLENQTELEDLLEATLTYRRKLKKEGGSWNTELKWFRDQDFENSDYIDRSTLTSFDHLEKSKAYVTEKYFLFQSDYVTPILNDGKLEFGVRSQWRNFHNNFGFSEQSGSEWIYPSQFNDIFLYDEKVHAAYAMGSNNFGNWGIQLGLRLEYSDIITEQKSLSNKENKQYLNYFPSAAVSYKINESTTAQVSYSSRIRRPGQWELMPFMKFGDNREMMVGNPDINPELTNAFEGGIMKYFPKGSLLASAYYRHTTDKIERMLEPSADGIIYRRPLNIAERNAVGLELNGSYNPTNWLRFNTGFNFYKDQINGEYKGEEFNRENFSWTNRTSANITLPYKIRFQVSANYQAPRVTAQGKTLSIFYSDLGASKDFWKNNATIGLNVRDLFNSRRWKSETETEYLYAQTDFQWRPRSVRLTFSYRFNQSNREDQPRKIQNFDVGMDGEG